MAALNDDIKTIKGIGEKKAQAFEKLGVHSLHDLISFFPRKYEDRSTISPIAAAPQNGESVCICAIVANEPTLTHIRKGMDLVRFRVYDESGAADISYFNQSWVKNNIHLGEEIIFFGKVDVTGRHRSMVNPIYEKAENAGTVTGKIMPVYKMCRGLTQKNILQSVRAGLDACGAALTEVLPDDVLTSQKLARVQYAYENIHFPADFTALEIARRRLVFEELFVLACAMQQQKHDRAETVGIRFALPDINEFYSVLPFNPTNAQKRAIADALTDMASGKAMNRLVQGDVGSGKTLVAAALVWAAHINGYLSALMVPTEILAEQHCANLSAMLEPFHIRVLRLTGSLTAKEKRAARESILRGEADLVIGTHALFSEGVEYPSLGLVITDEQHRFGVGQRTALIGKGTSPHVFVMSATPIPRTLALIIYGDLDVSIIDELPPGRQKVDTFAVNESYRERLNGFIRKQAAEGSQVFIVCPMVDEESEEDNTLNLRSAEKHAAELQQLMPELRIACVHGKMKPKLKDACMEAFSRGEYDVLVSTTVIEVGVDVPNATLMIIENAERFGLSQLHQLRGRVGRGKKKSWCILVSDHEGDDVKARLDIMCKTSDGFKISEEDLRLRGPGDFFGQRQHGLPEMHVADLGADAAILKKAKEEADRILAADPALSLPAHAPLKQRIDQLFTDKAVTMN